MDALEATKLAEATDWAIRHVTAEQRFTASDLCDWHKQWLGAVYEWAGEYRQGNISKGGFPFAMSKQVPRLMREFENNVLAGGSPFNVARHLRAFGLSPVLVSRAGSDARGEFVLNFMRRYGLDVRGVQRDALRPTGQVTVHVDEQGQRFEVLRDQAFDYIHAGVARLVALAVQPQMYYFGTLAQRCPVGRHALHVLLHSVAAPKMFDLNLRDAWYEPNTVERGLREADIAKMDTRELRMIAKAFRMSGGNDAEIAARLVERFSLQQIVVTDREETWVLAAKENESSAVVATSGCSIADTPGANDAFAAVFLLGTLERWPTALTLTRATEFSIEVARIQGASLSDEGIYTSFMSRWER